MLKTSMILIALGTISSGFALEIFKDGLPRAEIIVEKGMPANRIAAEDLQFHLERMSGVKIKIAEEPDESIPHKIYVGESFFTRKAGYQLPEFTSSGYDILVTENDLVLAGPNTIFPTPKFATTEEYWDFIREKYRPVDFGPGKGGINKDTGLSNSDDIGAWHAVCAFLEDLGVRFYAPGLEGTIIPRKKNIAVPAGRKTRQAAFERRNYASYFHQDKDSFFWIKRLKGGVRNGINCGHTAAGFIWHSENRQKHPSWYAEESPGKLYDGLMNQGGVPRYTDPDFRRASIDWARKLFDTYPHLTQVTVGAPEDANDPYDWRDRKIYQKPGMSHKQAYANMMYDFHAAIARELKKTHPDKGLIWWCLYNNCIPTNIDPATQPDNILCRVEAVPTTYYVRDDKYFDYIRSFDDMFAAFKPKGKSQQWEWWLNYSFDTSPRYPEFFMRRLQKVRQQQRQYVDGFFMEVACTIEQPRRIAEIPITHLMLYVNSKLMWDPDLDLDGLLDEYYRLWFGPAEKEMKAFHEFAETVWCRPGSRSVSMINGFLKEADIAKYIELLASAKAKTEEGSLYRKRIEAMEECYAGLKTLFADRTPGGTLLEIGTLPAEAKADGDLTKYRSAWIPLKTAFTGDADPRNRTEAIIALSEDKKHLFVAMRCHESRMDKLAERTKLFDTESVFDDDHIEIHVNTPLRNWFTVAVNPALAIWDECRDLENINRDALPVLWTPGTTTHVKRLPEGWEIEVSVPCRDFGKYGPDKEYPWGINLCRVRMASGKPERYALVPEGGEHPCHRQSNWLRMWKPSVDAYGRPVNRAWFIFQ